MTNDLLIDQEDINLDSNLQQDIRSGYIEPDVGVSFLSEVIGDPMNLAGAGTAKAVTAPQRVALSGKIADTVNSTLALNKSKSTALRAIDKFGENSVVGQRQAKVLEQTNRMLAENQKLLQKYGRDSLLLRLSAQSSPAELLRVAGQNLDTASDAGKASMNMVYNALKPSGKTSLVRQGAAMGARFAPEIAGNATVGASLMGPEGAAVGAAIPSLIKGLKILSTVPENVAISYIMRGAAEAGEDITEQAARKAWRSTTNKLLYPAGILGLGGGSLLKSDQEGLGDTIFNVGLSAAALKFIPKLAQLSDTVVRDSRVIGPELIFARGSEASPFFNRLALLPSADEGLIAANTDRFQALTRTSSGNTILERVIDKVRPIGSRSCNIGKKC